jgi:hypothetical protein
VVSLELAVCGRHTASRVAVVNDVVVNQRRGVKKVQPCCKINNPMLFGVFVGVDGYVAEGYRCPPAPISEASAKSLSPVKERFGYRREGIGVGRNLWDFTMRSRDNFSQIFGNAVNER